MPKAHRTTRSPQDEVLPGPLCASLNTAAWEVYTNDLVSSSFFNSYPVIKGYVYSSFLKPYNPAKVQKEGDESKSFDDDFDNISLFVSARPVTDSVTSTPEGSISDSSSSLSGTGGKFETNGTDVDSFQEVEEQVRLSVLR